MREEQNQVPKIQVFCINLKERPDRWERFMSQPGVQRISRAYKFERFEGVNGKLIDIKNDERVSLRTKRNIMYQKRRDHEDLDTPGGVGCYLSHYGTWKKFLEGNDEKLVIFEDDAEVPDSFIERFREAINDIENEGQMRPDIWLLSKPFGMTLKRALNLKDVEYQGNWAYDVTGPLTGYVLTREAAQVLCDNAFPIDGHVDHYMHRCAQMGMVTIAHNKNITLKQIRLMQKDSDIQQKESCEVCNLPDTPMQKGYLIVSAQGITSIMVGLMALGGLFALRMYSKK